MRAPAMTASQAIARRVSTRRSGASAGVMLVIVGSPSLRSAPPGRACGSTRKLPKSSPCRRTCHSFADGLFGGLRCSLLGLDPGPELADHVLHHQRFLPAVGQVLVVLV